MTFQYIKLYIYWATLKQTLDTIAVSARFSHVGLHTSLSKNATIHTSGVNDENLKSKIMHEPNDLSVYRIVYIFGYTKADIG